MFNYYCEIKSEMNIFISGHAASVIRDKFLVMSTELQDEKSPSELAALWKTIPKANIVEHRSVIPTSLTKLNFFLWTSILSRGSRNTSSRFMPQKPG